MAVEVLEQDEILPVLIEPFSCLSCHGYWELDAYKGPFKCPTCEGSPWLVHMRERHYNLNPNWKEQEESRRRQHEAYQKRGRQS